MGNAAAKTLDETALVVGTVKPNDEKAIAKTTVSADATKIKSKGKTWVRDGGDGAVVWTYKHVGTGKLKLKKHTLVTDAAGDQVATILTVKKSMNSCSNVICRSEPCFADQAALSKDELAAAGMDEGAVLYPFARYDTTRTMTTAKCKYGIVTGPGDAVEALYEGEKLSSMGFKAIFREAGGGAVAKAYMPGVSMTPHLEAAAGVDLLAVVSIGYALAGDESSAGALAGAGVI